MYCQYTGSVLSPALPGSVLSPNIDNTGSVLLPGCIVTHTMSQHCQVVYCHPLPGNVGWQYTTWQCWVVYCHPALPGSVLSPTLAGSVMLGDNTLPVLSPSMPGSVLSPIHYQVVYCHTTLGDNTLCSVLSPSMPCSVTHTLPGSVLSHVGWQYTTR